MATEERCKLCNAPFMRSQQHMKYCCLECSIKANKEITQVIWRQKKSLQKKIQKPFKNCDQCHRDFVPHIDAKQRFCSKECAKSFERLQWVKRELRR